MDGPADGVIPLPAIRLLGTSQILNILFNPEYSSRRPGQAIGARKTTRIVLLSDDSRRLRGSRSGAPIRRSHFRVQTSCLVMNRKFALTAPISEIPWFVAHLLLRDKGKPLLWESSLEDSVS